VRRFSSWFVFHVSQRTRLRIMAFITIADTGLISYVSTRNLAERWGFGSLSWLYPLCLDAVAAVGMDLWMSNSPAKRAAAWLSLTAVALSLAANVADWLYVGPGAAVLGAVPPLMLAALLLTMHRHGAHTEHTQAPTQVSTTTEQASRNHSDSATDTVVPVPAADPTERADQPPAEVPAPDMPDTAVPVPVPVPVPPHQPAPVPTKIPRRHRKGPKPQVPDDVVVAALREHEQEDNPLTRRQAMDMFHMGTNRADRLLAEAQNAARDGVRDEAPNGTQVDLAMLDHGSPDAGS
jgi:outer membrane biosynthesis protein TonB